MTRYIAYAVDVFGIANATYELRCANDKDAEERVRELLEAHQTIELWEGLRRVALLTRDMDARPSIHNCDLATAKTRRESSGSPSAIGRWHERSGS
jgi:hypothetical protein